MVTELGSVRSELTGSVTDGHSFFFLAFPSDKSNAILGSAAVTFGMQVHPKVEHIPLFKCPHNCH